MKLSDWDPGRLRRELAGAGISLNLAPFTVAVTSPHPEVGDGMRDMYPDCEVTGTGFADFHLNLASRRQLVPGHRACVLNVDGQRPFHPLPGNQAFAVFEWGLNWCITSYAHGWLLVHAAVVARGGEALILPGAPGSGKSTLAAALMARGWRLLSDELCMIRREDGRIQPLARALSLKNRSIDIARDLMPDAELTRPIADTVKGTVCHMRASPGSRSAAAETAAARWIVFPRFVEDAALSVVAEQRADALVRMVENAFNFHVLGEEAYELLRDTVSSSGVWTMEYGRLGDALDAVAALTAERMSAAPTGRTRATGID